MTRGRTNRSLLDVGGAALVVSQFTLYADTRRGRRPGLHRRGTAGSGDPVLYERFCGAVERAGVTVARGRFGAEMAVELVNDGPFTIWLDRTTAERGHDEPPGDRGSRDGASVREAPAPGAAEALRRP